MSQVNKRTDSARHRTPTLPTFGVLLIAAGFALNLSMVLATINNGVHPDFVGLHAAAREFDSGRPLYSTVIEGTRNLNPPHVVVATWPLAWLSGSHAIVVWWLFFVACAWFCVSLWGRVLPAPYPLIVLGAILVTPAGYAAFRFGSWTWPLTAVISWAWISARTGEDRRTGVLLGILASWRVFALLFVPYLLWKRQWTTVAWLSITFAGIWGAGLLLSGSQPYLDWLSALGRIEWYGDYYNSSFRGFSHRLLNDSLARPNWVTPAWLGLAATAVAAAWLRVRRGSDIDVEWASVVLLSLLLSPLGWSYYMALAAGPVAAISYRRRSAAALFALALFGVPWAVVSQVVTPGNFVFLLSLHLWGALALLTFCLLRVGRQVRGEPDASRSAVRVIA